MIFKPGIDQEKEIREERDIGMYDKYVKNYCVGCGKRIIESLSRYMVNGNYCDKCNSACSIKNKKKKQTKYINKRYMKEEVQEPCTGDCTNCSNTNCPSNYSIKFLRG